MINVVVEDKYDINRSDCRYKIQRVGEYNNNIRISERSLEELTEEAIRNNYKIYSQDDYELVIRKKK